MTIKEYKACVIGSGPAGVTAGIYLARSRVDVCVFGTTLGQLSYTTHVENFPGFPEAIMGPELMERMKQQAINFGCEFKMEYIEKIEKVGNSFTLYSGENKYKCRTLIIATGSEPKWLGLESENHFKGYGVSSCATCDGPFYKDKVVAVVGGGNTAVEEAIYLSGIAKEVFLIHRRDRLRAEKIMQERLFEKKNVKLMWNSEVQEIFGTEEPKNVESILVYNQETKELTTLSVAALFVAIGYNPQSTLVKDFVELDEFGYIEETMTGGLFIAGDVGDSKYRQAITSAGEGCRAAMDVVRFLEGGIGREKSPNKIRFDRDKKDFRAEFKEKGNTERNMEDNENIRPKRDADRGERATANAFRGELERRGERRDFERRGGRSEGSGSRDRNGGGFKPRGEGGFRERSGDRSGGGFRDGGGDRSGGGFKPRGEGGFRDRGEGSFKPRGEGGFRERSGGGFRDRNGGGFKPRGEGGFRDRSEGGFKPRDESQSIFRTDTDQSTSSETENKIGRRNLDADRRSSPFGRGRPSFGGRSGGRSGGFGGRSGGRPSFGGRSGGSGGSRSGGFGRSGSSEGRSSFGERSGGFGEKREFTRERSAENKSSFSPSFGEKRRFDSGKKFGASRPSGRFGDKKPGAGRFGKSGGGFGARSGGSRSAGKRSIDKA